MGREDSTSSGVTTLAQQVVDGLVLPRPVAGHPALELVNSRAGWDEPDPGEYLHSYRHLVVLAQSQRLVTAAEAARLAAAAQGEPQAADPVLRHALRFRQQLHAVLAHRADGALDGLNADLRRAAAARSIGRVAPDGIVWSLSDQGLRAPLTAFAWQAYRLLDSPEATAVRVCPGRGCGWLFLDLRGQRRWCIMALCGNREKARRYAQRERVTAR
jgi:predicted RNA-binding Zn ribbon-like protein